MSNLTVTVVDTNNIDVQVTPTPAQVINIDRGMIGPQGPQGEQGPQGIQGEKGDTGAQGPKGDTGATGATGAGVATGGTTGQVLVKASNANYDTIWVSLSGLSYQGTWNASSNTPALTSSVGTQGNYYIVNVAGSTNLNGITDWQIGDWAIFEGSIWQKIDNTDTVTSVNGKTGAVVLTNTDISGFGTMSTQNANAVAITGGSINGTTIGASIAADITGNTVTAATGFISQNFTGLPALGGNLKSSAGVALLNWDGAGSGNVTVNGGLNANPANKNVSIAPTGTGTATINPATTGAMDNMVIGATTAKAITGTTITATSFVGSGASITNVVNSLSASTGISVSGSTGAVTVTNTAPDQTVAISSGTGISVTGTYPNFTIANTSPSSGGTVTSVSATVPSFLSVSGSPITTSGTLALTYSGTALPVLNGGTGVTTSTGSGSNVLNTSPTLTTPAITGGTISNLTQELIGQSTDQGTGVLQVTGQSTFNGAVTDKSLNLQGGNNLFTYSQDFTNAAWEKSNTGSSNPVVTNVTNTDPSGASATISQIAYPAVSGAGNFSILAQRFTSSLTGYCDSVWLKGSVGGEIIYLMWTWNGVAYTTTTCTLTTSWQRFQLPFTAIAGTNFIQIGVDLRNTATQTAKSAQTIFAWGAQLELGTVASAYTPTTTAAVTTTNNINVPSGSVAISGNITGQSRLLIGTTTNPSAATVSSVFAQTGSGYIQLARTSSTLGGGLVGTDGTNLIFYTYTGAVGSETYTIFGRMNATGAFNINSPAGSYGIGSETNPDVIITRDSANTLAQRNSTNAQTFRLYNTYTDASNYERLGINWSSNTATIQTENAGTGTRRALAFGQDVTINTVTVGLGGGSVAGNTAVGQYAINATATGINNSAFGQYALNSVSSGQYNSAFGQGSLVFNTTGSFNTAGGVASLRTNVSGNSGVAIGWNALTNNTTASNLTAVGTQSLLNNTTNVATLGTITGGTGYTNGTYTGVVMTLSSGSSAITYPTATIVVSGGAVTSVTITSAGVAFKDTTTVLTAPAASIGGTGSGFTVPVATLASGTGNVAVGYQAGYSNSTGVQITSVGYQAGYSNTTGATTVFGYQAGYSNTTGSLLAFGQSAAYNNTTGNYSSVFGTSALFSNSSGNSLVAIGYSALQANTTGSNSVALGFRAGYGNASANANTTGSNNTYLGYQTVGSANNNTNEMVIGYQAVGLGSNTTVIGNTSTTLTQIYGVTKSTNYTVATLPSASTSGVGARAFVTDALTPVFGATVVTGGAVPTPVYSDGTNWKVG